MLGKKLSLSICLTRAALIVWFWTLGWSSTVSFIDWLHVKMYQNMLLLPLI
ncbi:hypothetical protein JHK82_046327 [Glycine max]|nr:hypothetical protein JHK87_046004 [Glycine soja]KAG5096473.1 hypothetical protein JHK82_046327 [Glycine max]KHN03430.1 hypothetical protein glysoja_004456 [Glycine soja]